MKDFIEAFFIALLSVMALLLVFAKTVNNVKNANDKAVSRLFEGFGIALTVSGIVIVTSMDFNTLDSSVIMWGMVKGTVLMTVGIQLINMSIDE